MTATAPIAAVRMTGISKSFGGVRALDNVDLEVLPGEVHALLDAAGGERFGFTGTARVGGGRCEQCPGDGKARQPTPERRLRHDRLLSA